jgi:hypothetical protein
MLTRRIDLKLIVLLCSAGLAAALLLALSACSGHRAATGTDPAPAPNVPAGLLAQLPPLPAPGAVSGAKAGSAAQTNYIGGISLYTGSANYGTQGNSLVLPSQPGGVEWGMYIVNMQGYTPLTIEPNITSQSGVAYVAVSDYGTGRWRFLGATDSPAVFTLPSGSETYPDATGKFFVLVLAWNGDTVLHNYSIVRYDDGLTQGPKVSGKILDENNQPLGGVTLTLTPGFLYTYTDAEGNYSISLVNDDTYTISPDKSGYTFNPPSSMVTIAGGADSSGNDFNGTSLDIRGHVMEGANGVGGVKVWLQSGPTTYTLADGSYEFQGVLTGMDTVYAKLPGYSFNPVSQSVIVGATDVNDVDFAATGGQPTYTISGKVLDAVTSDPIVDAVVSLQPDYIFVHTDATGAYSFTGLAPDEYKVNAYLQGYKITPKDLMVTVANADMPNQDFSAQQLYKLIGTLRGSGGFFLSGINVTLTPGNVTTTTGNDGVYTFNALVPGQYTVTPSSPLYTFTPLNQQVIITNTIGQAGDMTGALTGTVTYTNSISNIVSTYCTSCHSVNGNPSVDPMLTNYNEVKTWGAASNSRVQNGTMPPGNPLSAQKKELFSAWVAGGKPQ